VKDSQLDENLRTLRGDFDRSFAVAVAERDVKPLDFLTIRIAADPYALRLSEVASLHSERRLVVAPSPLLELCGFASFRGILTPVYDLGALLGYPRGTTKNRLVVVQWSSPIAFAFETLEAHVRVSAGQVSQTDRGRNGAVVGALRDQGRTVPLLHLPSLVEGIAQRIKAIGPSQER